MVVNKTENYYKWKLFKSEFRTYYVEIEINKYYSYDEAKLTIRLCLDDEKTVLAKEIFYISNYYNNSDLDVYAKRAIENYEDWKECD